MRYFCLKAGADRSRVQEARQNNLFNSTVLGFHHITEGTEAANGCYAERERELHGMYLACVGTGVELLSEHTARDQR